MVLKTFRSKTFSKNIFWLLLILILPAFVLWGIGSFTGQPPLVGTIDGKGITPSALAESQLGIRAQLFFAYFTDSETLNKLLRNRSLLNSMAWERLIFLHEAEKKRIKVSDDAIISFIYKQPLFQRGGAFDPDAYAYILRNALSMEPRQFEELMRENLKVIALRQDIIKDITVSDEEVSNYYRKLNSKVILSYLFFDRKDYEKDLTVSPEEASAYYAANKARFVAPAEVEVEYLEFPYSTEEEKQTALDLAGGIYRKLVSSQEDLGKFAAGQELKYGKTDPFSREDIIPGVPFFQEFYDTAFRLSKEDLSMPISPTADKGSYYILRKTGEIPSREKKLDEVLLEVEKIILSEKSASLAKKEADKVHSELSSSTDSLETKASLLGKTAVKTEAITYADYIDNVGSARDIVFAAQEKNPGDLLSHKKKKNGSAVIRVDQILPPSDETFEKEKDNLRTTLLIRKQVKVMEDWFSKNSSRAKLRTPLEEL